MNLNDFKKRMLELVESHLLSGRLNFNENHYSADLLVPFLKDSKFLNLAILFDANDTDNKRPDIRCYLSEEDKELDKNCQIIIESKLPKEFKGKTDREVLDKFLNEKVVPYILTYQDSVQFFLLHSFTRFISIQIDEEIVLLLNKFRQKQISKDLLLDALERNMSSINLEINTKAGRISELNQLVSYFLTNYAKKSLKALTRVNINRYIISNQATLKKFCHDLTDSIIGSTHQEGFLHEVQDYFDVEMEKRVSPVKISYRLFLSTRYPEAIDSAEIDSHDEKNERDLFVISTIYNVVAKLFIQKFVEDLYSGEQGVFPEDCCFLTLMSNDVANIEDYLKQSIENVVQKSAPAYQNILTGNDYFNWILSSGRLNVSNRFRSILDIFRGLDLKESIEGKGYNGDILGGFFEVFSEKFNKDIRRVFGQYYTPKEIVNFIWDKVLDICLKEKLDLGTVKLLDPACGSGTFLVEGIKKIKELKGQDLSNKVVAFDISPMASSLAEINIYAQMLRSTDPENLHSIKKINVFNTDSLNISESEYWQTRLGEEDDTARLRMLESQKVITKKYKKSKEYTLIVTNPPYNGSSSRTLNSFEGKFTLLDYLIQNRHADDRIRDDYVWFMGAIDRYINNNGVVALITSDTYVYRTTYKYLRKYLYDNYRIYSVYQLGKSVFDDVEIATSIIILSKFDDTVAIKKQSYAIDYYDLTNLKVNTSDRNKDERYLFLKGELTIEPQACSPTEDNNYSFNTATVEEDVRNCIPCFDSKDENAIIKKKYSGIITGFKELFVDTSRANLSVRMKDFFELVTIAKLGKKQTSNPSSTNAAVKELGMDLHQSAKYSRYQEKLREFLNKHNLEPKRNKENAELYCSFLVASALLKGMLFSEDAIKDCILPSEINKWLFPKSEKQYLYFDSLFSIPRITKNGSKVEGGPITAWREYNDAEDRVIFISQREKDGCSIMRPIFPGVYNPYFLMDAPKKGKAHFFRISDLEIPRIFRKFNFTKQDLCLYMQAVTNSEWVKEHGGYVVTNKVPLPLPAQNNINLIRRIINATKELNELSVLSFMFENKLKFAKVAHLVSSETLNSIKFNPKDEGAEFDTEKINSFISKRIRGLDSNINQLFKINISNTEDLTAMVEGKKQSFEPVTKFDKVIENRMGITSLIISSSKEDTFLGRTKFQKIFYMIDTLIEDQNFGTKYYREAAGPLDYSLMYSKNTSIETLASQMNMFKVVETSNKLFRYKDFEDIDYFHKVGQKISSKYEKEVSNILRIFKDCNTTRAELYATLYAVWNDMLIDKKKVTDQAIITEFLQSWHKKKTDKFEDKLHEVKRALQFMKDNGLIPKGKKNRTLIPKKIEITDDV